MVQSHIPALVAALATSDTDVVAAIAETLTKAPEESLTELSKAAEAEAGELRMGTAIALGTLIGHDPKLAKRALPILSELLTDEDWQVRRAAARGLGTAGRHATSALPELTSAMRERNKFVRRAAAAAIQSISEDEAQD